MKPSCCKWLDDLTVSDIEFDMDTESENDSSTTRFPVTAKRLKQNKVIRRKGDERDVSVCVLDGWHDEIVSSKKYQSVCRKKGPPCKRLEYLEKKKRAEKSDKLEKNSDSDRTSDLDYAPSDNSCTDFEDEMIIESETDNNNYRDRLHNESGNNEEEWFAVKGRHQRFAYEEHESMQDCVPDADQEPAEFYNLVK